MTQFSDVARAQAESARQTHLAEMEAARCVIAAIDGEPHTSLDEEITSLRGSLLRLEERLATALEGNRKLLARAVKAEEEVDRVKRFSETTEQALRDQLTLARAGARMNGEAADRAAASAKRAQAQAKRLKADVARLKAELDVAQGAPSAQLKSARKQPERGVHKSSQAVRLSDDARAVQNVVSEMRPGGHGPSFTASSVQKVLAVKKTQLSLPRVRAALKELEAVRSVQTLTNTRQGDAQRWIKLPAIRPAKRKGSGIPR